VNDPAALSHDLFLLMLNLSQLRDPPRIIQLFTEAINSRGLGLRLEFVPHTEEAGPASEEIATSNVAFGRIRFCGALADLPAHVPALLRNAVKMLALVLENRLQEAELRRFNQTLEEQVRERTAALERSNAALRESEQRLGMALEGARTGLWDYHPTTRYCYFSPQWFTMLGYAPDEFPHDHATWIRLLHPEDRTRCEAFLADFVAHSSQDEYCVDFRMQAKDGDWRWIQSCGRVFARDEHGVVTRMVGTHIDFTERKRNEDERERLESQLRQSQKLEAVGQLAGGVAHDFNNILTAILGNADLALHDAHQGPPSEPVRCALYEIQRSAQRAARLTRQLLAFSRHQAIRPDVLDLNRIVADIEDMLRRLLTEDIRLAITLVPGAACVRADAGQIEQIIMNLVLNARDAMSTGGVISVQTDQVVLDERTVGAHPDVRPGPYVLLEVSDTGRGMDAATRERVFEPFFTTKPVGVGTGLGLATVYGIVKQAGGFVTVESEVGQGTVFQVYFPTVVAPLGAEPREPQGERLPAGTETILICEDDSPVRQFAERVLQSEGYRVLAAASGAEACRLTEEGRGPVALLLTDVIMPDMNGRQLSERLSARVPGLRTLFVSGYTADIIAHHGVLDEGVEFLEKPFSRTELLQRIRQLLDRHPRQK